VKVRDCERDGYKLWGDQLLFDWLRDATGYVEVLAGLCRKMGGTVRLRWERV